MGRRPFGVRGPALTWDDANLQSKASIEVNVVDNLTRRGYRFKGTAIAHTGGEVFEHGVRLYEARGTIRARERIRGIVIVSVERALPLISPAYDLGFTEDELREQHLRRLTARNDAAQGPAD